MIRPLIPVGVLLALAGVNVPSAFGGAIHVPVDQPTIALGLAAAATGDTVLVASGTYYEREIVIPRGLTLRSETGDPNSTIVDGMYVGTIFFVNSVVDTVFIEGLTITRGTGNQGGGVRSVSSNVVIRKCVFLENTAAGPGEACLAAEGSLRCENCIVARSHPGTFGSAALFALSDARMTLLHCTVTHNGAGASFNQGGTVDAFWCILENSRVTTATGCWIYDPYFCADSTDFHLSSTSPCLPGVTGVPLIGALGLGCGATPQARTYTVATNPPGLAVTVDGAPYISPATFTWNQYSDHSVEVGAVLTAGTGSRLCFSSWSDGEARAHTLCATRDSGTYTANFALQHLLDVTASSGGSVSPAADWHAAGEHVTIAAAAAAANFLDRWEGTGNGSYSGTTNPAVVTMSGPISEHAVFAPNAYEFSVSASDVDPHVNASTPSGGLRYLYLWAACSRGGLSAFEADVHTSMLMFAFEPLNDVLNAGTAEHVLLAIPGCPTGDAVDRLLGRWTVYDVAPGGEMCLGGAGGGPDGPLALGAVDCGTVTPFCTVSPGVTGFSSTGLPCRTGTATCVGTQPVTGVTVTDEERGGTPQLSAAPNPFATSLGIRFNLVRSGAAAIRVYDVAGRLVRSLLAENRTAGPGALTWDGRDSVLRVVPNGVYFVRLEAGGIVSTRKVVRLTP